MIIPSFLSCLYGSQLRITDAQVAELFLSCLYGSQHAQCAAVSGFNFLSCLYGSQPLIRAFARSGPFLSCLYGSQLAPYIGKVMGDFLSCLYGSQLFVSRSCACVAFLSCLYGSQLQKKVKELRRHREKTHLHLFYPKFQQGARKADRIGFSRIGQKFWSKFRDRGTIAQAIGAQCSGLLYLTGCLLDEEGKGLCGR